MAQTKSNTPATGNVGTASAATDKSGAANIAPATEFDPAGAPVQIVPDVDVNHPAVDNDPRKGTSVDQNRIDFNDPIQTGSAAVAENLREQGQDVAEPKSDGKSDEK